MTLPHVPLNLFSAHTTRSTLLRACKIDRDHQTSTTSFLRDHVDEHQTDAFICKITLSHATWMLIRTDRLVCISYVPLQKCRVGTGIQYNRPLMCVRTRPGTFLPAPLYAEEIKKLLGHLNFWCTSVFNLIYSLKLKLVHGLPVSYHLTCSICASA